MAYIWEYQIAYRSNSVSTAKIAKNGLLTFHSHFRSRLTA